MIPLHELNKQFFESFLAATDAPAPEKKSKKPAPAIAPELPAKEDLAEP